MRNKIYNPTNYYHYNYHYKYQHIYNTNRHNKYFHINKKNKLSLLSLFINKKTYEEKKKKLIILLDKQFYKAVMCKCQNYLKGKTKNKKIDKKNELLHKTKGNPHHSIYILKQIAHIIQNNGKSKTGELKKLLLNLQANYSPFDIYNFFKKWLNKSENVSKMLIDTYHVSLFSTYINLFFADILFCFFIGNL